MFDTAKDSTMTFKSTGITKVSDKKFKLKGDLKLKGVTKSIELDLTLIGTTVNQRSKKNMAGFKVTGSIKRTDFGVGNMPSMMVSEDVELRASGEFVQN
jgi:polyisoprenoid-binding protein YceI